MEQAAFTWPLIFRPLHEALIKGSLDDAERALGGEPSAREWSPWVRLLRRLFRAGRRCSGR